MNRLPPPFGSRVDSNRPLRFRFEGREMTGLEGDTVTSALAANGQWVLSRSFKYHRPRGTFSMTGAEANALVRIGDVPNVNADLTPLREGMEIAAQNVLGSLRFDLGRSLDRMRRFLPVGFYYRTFFGPGRGAWRRLWEPPIRRAAGLGRIAPNARPGLPHPVTLHCDLAVIGAGPAGLAAAVAAAEAGLDVIICEAEPELGGSALWTGERETTDELCARIRRAPGLRTMTGTVCTGWYADNTLSLLRDGRLVRVRAGEVIFATGRIAQPALFDGNDLPGVLSAEAALRLLHLYGVRPGSRCVVAGDGPVASRVVDACRRAGIDVAGQPSRIARARGNWHVEGVETEAGPLECDHLVIAGGSMPSWHLPCQSGWTLAFDEAGSAGLSQGPARTILAGSLRGEGLGAEDGRAAAARAIARLSGNADPGQAAPGDRRFADAMTARGGFVDFDEDLKVADIAHAAAEGYTELELLKRFTTGGMGPSQGRHSALGLARLLGAATDRPLSALGVTTARPPAVPEPLGALAGPDHHAERRTALHALHLEAGADMRPVGAWWRPYGYGGGTDSEVALVRDGCGMLDVSTLGKIEVRGPDAGAFLDRFYTMAHAGQPIGRVRYCLALNEQGSVIDDGVAWRMADDRYYVTATTGAVARILSDMAYWNARWGMAVDVLDLTGAFAAINVTGPGARDVLSRLEGDLDVSAAGFPYLTGTEATLGDVPVRALRIGFTGEISYELHCRGRQAPHLWRLLVEAGARPYGLEASRVLRLEKAHILIGQDTDALTTPDELGFGWALSARKPFYLGKRAVEMRRRLGQARRQVRVVFAPGADLPAESDLVMREGRPVGHVTSVAWSPTLKHGIALAFARPEDAVEGAELMVRGRAGQTFYGIVTEQPFYDPEGRRQEA